MSFSAEYRARAVRRLTCAPDRKALQRVWESFGVDVQHDAEIRALKDQLKAQFEREAAA